MARKKNKNVENELDLTVETVSETNIAEGVETTTGVETEAALFLNEDEATEGFLPEANEENIEVLATETIEADLGGTELEGFEAAQIEDLLFIEDEQIESIIESILFASDRPVSFASIQQVFKGTTVKKDKIKRAISAIAVEYAGGRRGVTLEEITGGYQIRTKVDNMNFLKQTIKARPFKLSGPALETLAIVAYKQPVVKLEVDQIRGVESGHLMRALMEKGLVSFEGKAEHLPGKPMQYGTTRRFLEIFGLRNLKELPTLSQIDELLPEGIGEEVEEKATLSSVTDSMAQDVKEVSYSQGEEELMAIEGELAAVATSSDFFEQEKQRQKAKRDEERAQNIREALTVGEAVERKDANWLKRYEEALIAVQNPAGVETTEEGALEGEITAETIMAVEAAANTEAEVETESDDEVAHIEDELPFYEDGEGEDSLV